MYAILLLTAECIRPVSRASGMQHNWYVPYSGSSHALEISSGQMHDRLYGIQYSEAGA